MATLHNGDEGLEKCGENQIVGEGLRTRRADYMM